MRSLKKIILGESFMAHEDKLKVFCYVWHFQISLGRKDLVSKYIKNMKVEVLEKKMTYLKSIWFSLHLI